MWTCNVIASWENFNRLRNWSPWNLEMSFHRVAKWSLGYSCAFTTASAWAHSSLVAAASIRGSDVVLCSSPSSHVCVFALLYYSIKASSLSFPQLFRTGSVKKVIGHIQHSKRSKEICIRKSVKQRNQIYQSCETKHEILRQLRGTSWLLYNDYIVLLTW